MTHDDVLNGLLAVLDSGGGVLDQFDMADWPAGMFDSVKCLGLLTPAESGLMATCPSCSDPHLEPVEIAEYPGGVTRWFIHCPESLRVEVTPDMCRGWSVSVSGLAVVLAQSLGLRGSPRAVVPGRYWRLGRLAWDGATREVVLAFRLCDDDAHTVVQHAGPSGRPVVFVPSSIPDERIWPGHIPPVIALSRVATLDEGDLVVDPVAFAESIEAADALAETRSIVPVDPEVKKQVVRQQVKAEIKGHLEDDVLIAAYITHGSFRKAGDALTDQLGRKVSKDAVKRAVDRAGGASDVLDGADSASVARTVASQSCDRQKKFLERR